MIDIKKLFVVLLLLPIMFGCSKRDTNVAANPDIPGKFVFHSLRSGVDREGWGIYVLKGGKIKLISKKGSFPRWSPDGKLISCYRKDIMFFDEEGNLKRKTDTKYQPHDYVWSPDGKFIIYSGDDGWGRDTYNMYFVLLNLEDGSETILKEFHDKVPISFNVHEIYISSDGKRVVFLAGTQGRDDNYIGIMDVDGSNFRQLRKNGYPVSWFPDSKNVLISSNLDEEGNLINNEFGQMYKLNVDTGETSIIEETQHTFYRDKRLSKDGKYIYYVVSVTQYGTQIMMSPLGRMDEQIPVTHCIYINPNIGHSTDTQPDWYQVD